MILLANFIATQKSPEKGNSTTKIDAVVIGCKGNVAKNALLTLLQVQELIGKLFRICETKSYLMMRNLSIQL